MPKSIFKYPMPVRDCLTVMLPRAAQMLSIQMQREQIVMWALIEEGVPAEPKTFYMVGTGQPMPQLDLQHVASIQNSNGALEMHIFEPKPAADEKPVVKQQAVIPFPVEKRRATRRAGQGTS